jgi:two-component system, LytTR family, sensor kinase
VDHILLGPRLQACGQFTGEITGTMDHVRIGSRDEVRSRPGKHWLLILGWVLVVLVFAVQWYAYDAGHGVADPLLDYIGWSCYLWGVLTPLVLWFAKRHPIDSRSWPQAVPLHVTAGVAVGVLQLSAEAALEWLRSGGTWPVRALLWHYLSQHLEVTLLTYWALVGAAQIYRMHQEARQRQLHAAQLEASLAATRLEALRAQLQPHFLFNTLQAATTLIHEDPDAAEDTLLCLSDLLRASLEELSTQEVPLSREIEFLELYSRIQQRRFGDRLRFELQIDPALAACAVPSLILQPLVENAIRHGIGKHKGSDIISIRASSERGQLCLEIGNLTGSLDDSPERLLEKGVGLANTRLRIEQLYGNRQSLQLLNLSPRGVRALLSIPLRLLPVEEILVGEELAQ